MSNQRYSPSPPRVTEDAVCFIDYNGGEEILDEGRKEAPDSADQNTGEFCHFVSVFHIFLCTKMWIGPGLAMAGLKNSGISELSFKKRMFICMKWLG